MPQSETLLAWIELRANNDALVAFVGKPAALRRAPAMQLCASTDDARQWVEREAAKLGLPIEWASAAPTR